MKRFVRLLLVLPLAATAVSPSAGAVASGADVLPPNVLLIVTDDQRADALEVMPRTNREFAERGTTFTQAFATTPTCCPSRASIMTGRYAHNHGVHTSGDGEADRLDQDSTLQRYLQAGGYRTALFGKFLNHWGARPAPHFDEWALFADSSGRSYRHGRWNVQGEVRKVRRYSTAFLERRALRFLKASESEDERPWFLYLTALAPHRPAIPARRFADARVPAFDPSPAVLELDRTDKPRYVQESSVDLASIRAFRRSQLRTLMSVDEMVGALFAALREQKERRATLAFFISDNGLLAGEHGLSGKRFPYLDSVRIPLLVTWRGVVEEGATDDRLAATIDVAPTILAAAGLVPEHVVDGRSLLEPWARQRLLLEHWARADRSTPDWAATLTPNYQYVEHYVTDRFVPQTLEYYDLISDPWQLENLLGDSDTSNDPDVAEHSLRLQRDANCSGTNGAQGCP